MPYYAGSVVPLGVTFERGDNSLIDPTNPRAVITYPDLVTTVTVPLTLVSLGNYVGPAVVAANGVRVNGWQVPSDAPAGSYTVGYQGFFDGLEQSSPVEGFVVVPVTGHIIPGLTGHGYCTIQDVEAKGTVHGTGANAVYSATTTPTADQVRARIAFRATEIDGRLSLVGVSVPVDPTVSPRAFTLLGDLNAIGAAADAMQIAYFRSNPNKSEAPKLLIEQYENVLRRYAGDGSIEANKDAGARYPGNPYLLIDAVLSGNAPEPMTRRFPWSGSMAPAGIQGPQRQS